MKYIPLEKIYYKNNANWKREYDLRFNSPNSRRFEFLIKGFNYKKEYPAFFCYTEELAVIQNEITAFSIKLIKLLHTVPELAIQQILQTYLFEEIQFNNAIEGIRSSRREIEGAISYEKVPKRYLRLWGIANKYKKITNEEDIPIKTSMDMHNLYKEFIHQEIIKDNPINDLDGELFRKNGVNVITATQRVLHAGVYPEENIIEYMNKALAILHDNTIPSLIRIAVFHYLFAYIHPFYDGNGRMIRFITSYFLAKEIDPIIALRLSFMIKSQGNKYYSLFSETNSSKNCGDLTPFITESLYLLLYTIKSTLTNLNKKLTVFNKLQKSMDELLVKLESQDKLMPSIYYVLLTGTIFSKFGLTIVEMSSTMEKTRNTIQTRIDMMPEEHIVLNKKNKPYRYKLNLKILQS